MDFFGYGYTFPFPIICAENSMEWPVFEANHSGTSVVIFPPFLSGNNGRLTENFDLNGSPSFKMLGITIGGSSSLPKGFRTIPQYFGEQGAAHPPQIEANAFQIEIMTKDASRADKLSSWLIPSVLRNLKRISGQFWVDHPATYFEGYKKTQYKVSGGKLPHNKIWAHSTIYSGNLRMQVINNAAWQKAWASATENHNSDPFDNLLLAEHQVAGSFCFDATSNCALAIEKAKYVLWDKIRNSGLCSNAEYKSAKNDTHKPERYFKEKLPEGLSLDLTKNQILTLSEVWNARGLIAHGKEKHLRKALGYEIDRSKVYN